MMNKLRRSWCTRLFVLLLCTAATARAAVLDDLRDASAWKASGSDQVKSELQRDRDGSLCLHYDFGSVSGYAVMRRELPVDWPAAFDLGLRLKADGPPNDVQVKWADDSGDNVWWTRPATGRVGPQLKTLKLRPRHVDFAWGPATDKALKRTRWFELVAVATERGGGRGRVCLGGFALSPRAPDPATWPQPHWQHSTAGWTVDLGAERDFNGVQLQWPAGTGALRYTLEASADARRWQVVRSVQRRGAEADALFVPDTLARHLRLRGARTVQPPQISVQDARSWPDLNASFKTRAAALPRGDVPRMWLGEQSYWTLVGVDGGGARSALIGEDGAVEVGRGGFSLEPVLWRDDGTRVAWSDAQVRQTLPDGHLPLPQVHWLDPGGQLQLQVQAAADGAAASPQLLVRYVLNNSSPRTRRVTLGLALRPWQVNPPQQFLATPGGHSPVATLRAGEGGRRLRVNDAVDLRFTRPADCRALPLDAGIGLAALQRSTSGCDLRDPQQHASALLRWTVDLEPGQAVTIGLEAPLAAGQPATATADLDVAQVDRRFAAATDAWRQRLGGVALDGPAEVKVLHHTLRTSLAHLLMSRDGPALRPGTRSYARTWIRDGAMMASALVRVGEVAVAREFVDWFAGYLFTSGKVPCCVDARGADPVVENDSHGQYLFAVAEVWRATGDKAWAARHWPAVQRTVAWLEGLRQSQRTDAQRQPDAAHRFGLLPPSISHEGYSDKPAYALWDDFWALRGLRDAVQLAQAQGEHETAARWAGWRDEFERELAAAVMASARVHGVNHVVGAADRGDFDATSTTVALDPAQADVPSALLAATFERYAAEADARAEGRRNWVDYTPYEWRNVGALVRVGQVAEAHRLMRFLMRDRRPPGWNQWAEVVLPDPRAPKFLGDMPHAWVSSDFMRSALDLFAIADERQQRVLLGAGWTEAWLRHPELTLRGFRTPAGALDLTLTRDDSGWTLSLPRALSAGPAVPASATTGGDDARRWTVVLRWPDGLALPRAQVDGRALVWNGRELELPPPPVRLQLLRD